MKEVHKEKINVIKIIITIIFMVLFIVLVTNSTNILKNSTDTVIVVDGSLSFEEPTEGYVIRDEVVLQGENYKNGMVQIVSDGERAAKNEDVFRYYSNGEKDILEQIAELDEEINELIENEDINQNTQSDFVSLGKSIEETIDSMYNLNYLQEIKEHKNEIDAYISKKAQMTEILSPENSYVKTLIDQRNNLKAELEKGSEVIKAPVSGLASYRVDGLEEVLKVGNFDYLSTELLEGFNLKVGASVPLSSEKGKIVNNFESYIAVSMNTERSTTAKVGDTVTLRLSNSDEIQSEIVYIKDESNSRILVFKVDKDIAELLEYRKISLDIIWWKYTGLKVSNNALIEENDKIYVERDRAGYIDKILVKVLRQNDTYSIVENYEDDELRELGYSEDEISEMNKIKLYDEVLLH
ncbi:MAG TPA: hypothetical protein IAD08_05180 [Candidatus Scatovivens faecipullorum]|nr:hypothetical protein [Candidatus Scatovivens faecipullorum]